MPEIAEARALLAALAETDDGQGERRAARAASRLHVAYGNALFLARGYGAAETTGSLRKGSRVHNRRQRRA